MGDIGEGSASPRGFTPRVRSLQLPGRSPLGSPESASHPVAVRGRRASSELVRASTVKRRYLVSAPREVTDRTSTPAPLLEENRRLDSPSVTSPSAKSPIQFELSKQWVPPLPLKMQSLPVTGKTVPLGASTTVPGHHRGKATSIQPVGDSLPRKGAGERAGNTFSPSNTTRQSKQSQSLHPKTFPSPLLTNEGVVRAHYEGHRGHFGMAGQPYDDSRRSALHPETRSRQGTMPQLGRRLSEIESIWRSRAYRLNMAAAVVVYCALIFAIGVIADRGFPYCEHPTKCFDLARELEASMDTSVDPCSDMYGHVCGRWSDQYPGKRHQFALLNERLRFVLLRAAERSRDPTNAADKAGLALSSCMRVWSSGDVDKAVYIGDVLKRRGLTWPATTNVEVRDVFRQLVAFTLKDALSVFFALKVMTYLKAEDRYTFELRYPQLMMEPILDPDELQTCIKTYNRSVDVAGITMQIINLELDFAASMAVNSAYDYSPKYHKFADIDAMYNSSFVTSARWVDAINEHLPNDAAIDSDKLFLLYDKFALSAVVDILSAYSDRTMNLQNFIGWKIIRYLSYGASSKLSTCDKHGEYRSWSFTFPVALKRCLTYVSEVVPYGLLQLQLMGVLEGSAITYARNMTDDVRRAIEVSYNFSWLDEQSAAGAVRRLRSIRAVVGGPSGLLSPAAIDVHYTHVPGIYGGNFVNWLVDSYRAVAERKVRLVYPPDNPEHRSPSREDWDLKEITTSAFYLPTYHLIYVPGALLMPPFLSASAPDSFNYGALGKVVGHELTHAFDPKYIDVNYAREPDVFYTPQFKEKFTEKIDCLILQTNAMLQDSSVGERTITESFADNSGTELAYLTYWALAETRRKEGVIGLTADQSFFVATCFLLCGAEGEKQLENSVYLSLKVRCNQPLMNTEQFAEAFSCALGTPMRPQKRCDIHTPAIALRKR
ncbi:endothelin-converting enzyme homolog [Rhipicephalus microplus]|uniref:endothelin-converting enzyme homolog n=1 Tax=Rhipicephalus microplus TaxID=6941 RepID=UPI003F6AC3A8